MVVGLKIYKVKDKETYNHLNTLSSEIFKKITIKKY